VLSPNAFEGARYTHVIAPGNATSHTANPTDLARRHWLAATAAASGVGIAATSVPFIASMIPSERAHALGAPVEVDVNAIKPGKLQTVEWRGKPIIVGSGMQGDRAAVIFSRPEEMSAFIHRECP